MSSIFSVCPSKWEVDHVAGIAQGQAYAESHDGQLPDTRAWRMLERRHDLAPARFDHFHPNVGRLIERAEAVSFAPIDWSCPTPSPVVVAELVVPAVSSHATPEPSSLVLSVLAVAVFAAARINVKGEVARG